MKAAIIIFGIIAVWAIFVGALAPRHAHGDPCCRLGHESICPCR